MRCGHLRALSVALALGAGGLLTAAPMVATAASPALAAPVALPAQASTTVPIAPSSAETGTSTVSQIDDPASSRRVNRIIAALLGLAALVLVLTIWFWRSTTPLHPALEGVDLMSSRSYQRAKPSKRAEMLGELARRRGDLTERIADERTPERDPTPVDGPAPEDVHAAPS
jgi:hypothetical protein